MASSPSASACARARLTTLLGSPGLQPATHSISLFYYNPKPAPPAKNTLQQAILLPATHVCVTNTHTHWTQIIWQPKSKGCSEILLNGCCGCDGGQSEWPEHGDGGEGRGCRGGCSPLTLSQVVPVGAGEKGVAAQALVAQPLPGSAQEALHQVHQEPAGAHLLWELQVPLRGRNTPRWSRNY